MADREQIELALVTDTTGAKQATAALGTVKVAATAAGAATYGFAAAGTMASAATTHFASTSALAAAGTTRLATAQQAASSSLRTYSNSTGAASKGSADFGRSILMASQGIEDFNYAGVKGVLNNIPVLALALGLGPGLAGMISIVAVGASILADKWKDLAGVFGQQVVQSEAERMKELGDQVRRTAEEQAKLNSLKGQEAAGNAQAGLRSKPIQEMSKKVLDTIAAGPGDDPGLQLRESLKRVIGESLTDDDRMELDRLNKWANNQSLSRTGQASAQANLAAFKQKMAEQADENAAGMLSRAQTDPQSLKELVAIIRGAPDQFQPGLADKLERSDPATAKANQEWVDKFNANAEFQGRKIREQLARKQASDDADFDQANEIRALQSKLINDKIKRAQAEDDEQKAVARTRYDAARAREQKRIDRFATGGAFDALNSPIEQSLMMSRRQGLSDKVADDAAVERGAAEIVNSGRYRTRTGAIRSDVNLDDAREISKRLVAQQRDKLDAVIGPSSIRATEESTEALAALKIEVRNLAQKLANGVKAGVILK